jgi:hypothetical protein
MENCTNPANSKLFPGQSKGVVIDESWFCSIVSQHIKDLRQRMRHWRLRTSMALIILLVEGTFPRVGFGASTGALGIRGCLLPWQTIAEKVCEGSRFCTNNDLPDTNTRPRITGGGGDLDPNCNYAYQPNQAITIELLVGTVVSRSLQGIDVNLAKWAEGSWHEMGEANANMKPTGIVVTDRIREEGFFRLQPALKAQSGRLSNFEAYAIVLGNWKKDILAFCHGLKEEIETNRDPQLICSSISVSHCDHAMEVISEASILSGEVLGVLGKAVRSKQDFSAGKCPDLVIGLNKLRLKRFEGAPIEEFVVFIPDSYTSSKAWPVFLHTDNRRWGARDKYRVRSGLIDIWWHTVKDKGVNWKSYDGLMKILGQKLNIDEDRVYVNGECGNGLAAMSLALNYPDHWAECSVSLTSTYRYMAGNALNLPLIFVKGGHNEPHYIAYYDFAVKCFRYQGCRHLEYSKTRTTAQVRGGPLPEAVREKSPQRVLYTIESLGNQRAYWVKIDGRQDENLIGTIDASVDGQTIVVKTSNVDAYSLYLVQAPLDSNKPVEIVENGQSLGLVTNRIFTKRTGKYVNAAILKNERLHGPVQDAFTDPYVVVWGSGDQDIGFSNVSERFAESLANGASCFADTNMPEELIESHNLILIGTAESNLWLSKICKDLPVQVEEGQIVAGGTSYDGPDMGFIFVYPNPINPNRYAVVFCGTSSRAMMSISTAYSQMKSLRPADVGVFEITKTGSIKWHIIEKFNTVWGWHDEWDRVLAETNKKHPHGQWRQWVTRALRKQLEVDVAVCEDPLLFADPISVGQITYRDLFNSFRNKWIVTISITGKSLRALLTVPFTDISKREVNAPIIDGVSLIKNPADDGEKILEINELIHDKIYTVALPEKCINGERIGLVFQDYNIVNQMYLVPILKEHLKTDSKANIDKELDSLKLAIF